MSLRRLVLGSLLAALFLLTSSVHARPCAQPDWPVEAKRYELEGVTEIRFKIAPGGNVVEPRIAKSSRWAMLDEAAMNALMACNFADIAKPAAVSDEMPVQYLWTQEGRRVSLLPDSCEQSPLFARFAPYDNGVTDKDGVLVRFQLDSEGDPIRIKVEGDKVPPATVDDAMRYLKSCRFAVRTSARRDVAGAVTGRVIYR